MISNKGFQYMIHLRNYTQFTRTFSVFNQSLCDKFQPYQSRKNNFYKKDSDHDDHGFRQNNHAGPYRQNNYSGAHRKNNSGGSFKNKSFSDTFGNMDENAARMFEYKEDPDDIEELQRQRTVVYKPMLQHIEEIKSHLRRRDYKKAREVSDYILQNERRRAPSYIFDLLLAYCSHCGDLEEAYKLYLMLKRRQYFINGGNYTSLFNAAALCPKRELALQRIRKVTEDLMTDTFCPPNVANYNAMLKAYARHGDFDMCLKIVDAVIAERGSAPTATYNHLLQACITDKNSGFRHAMAIWHKMLQKKTKPDSYTFNLLLRCVRECSLGPVELLDTFIREILSYNKKEEQKLVERKSMELPESVELVEDEKSEEFDESAPRALEEVKPSEVELTNQQVFSSNLPNLFLKNPTIGPIIKLNRISTPQDRFLLMGGLPGFFKLLSDFKVKPNKKTLAQLIDVIPNNFEAEEECIKFLEEKKINLTIDFVNVLLKRRIFRRESKEHIKGCLKLLQEHSLVPDIFTYGTYALSCDTLEEAEDFLQLLKDAGVSLNTPMWNALLLNALRSSDLKYAKVMIQVGKEANVQPDSISLKYLKRLVRDYRGSNYGREKHFRNENYSKDSNLGSVYGEWTPEKEEEVEKSENLKSEELNFKDFESPSGREANNFENQELDSFESIENPNLEDLKPEDEFGSYQKSRYNSESNSNNVESDEVQEIRNFISESNNEVKSEFSKEDIFQSHEKSILKDSESKLEKETLKDASKNAGDAKFEEFQDLYSAFSQKEVESEFGKMDEPETTKKSNVNEKSKSDSENVDEISIDENKKLVTEYLRGKEKLNLRK